MAAFSAGLGTLAGVVQVLGLLRWVAAGMLQPFGVAGAADINSIAFSV